MAEQLKVHYCGEADPRGRDRQSLVVITSALAEMGNVWNNPYTLDPLRMAQERRLSGGFNGELASNSRLLAEADCGIAIVPFADNQIPDAATRVVTNTLKLAHQYHRFVLLFTSRDKSLLPSLEMGDDNFVIQAFPESPQQIRRTTLEFQDYVASEDRRSNRLWRIEESIIDVGDLRIDGSRFRVFRGGQEINIGGIEVFRMLFYLAYNRGHKLTWKELAHELKGQDESGRWRIISTFNDLREGLGDVGEHSKYFARGEREGIRDGLMMYQKPIESRAEVVAQYEELFSALKQVGYFNPNTPEAQLDSTPLKYGPFSLDLPEREVRINGLELALTQKEFEVFLVLMLNPGVTISPKAFLSIIWPDRQSSDSDVLRFNINNIRKKLGDNSSSLVSEIKRIGNRFHAHYGLVLDKIQPEGA